MIIPDILLTEEIYINVNQLMKVLLILVLGYKSTIQKHKPKVFVEPQRKVSSFAQLNKDDEDNLLLELHLSDKELLSLNKPLEEQINEQSSELENLSSLNLTTKLSEQETQIKTINDDNEENKKTKATLFYDPRNLPLHTCQELYLIESYKKLL
ncbi:unnamed protein product [Rhizophagus irregularis]|nr:unnamed protein product [Rhizophagus irregularis]